MLLSDNAQNLMTHIRQFLESQPTIQAAWLIGSYGRGDQDAWSDIDVIACVESNPVEAFTQIKETIGIFPGHLFHKSLPNGMTLNVITKDWHRFDVTCIDASKLGDQYYDEIRILFDRTYIADILPKTRIKTSFPKPALQDITEEFIRILGLLPVVLGRENYVSATSGIQIMKDLLIKLMKLEQGDQPHYGALSLKKAVSTENYRLLQDMPPVSQDREALLALNRYLAGLFLPKAKILYQSNHMSWPDEFVDTTLAYLEKEVGLTL